jgi:NAD(P)-binding Rossmann-like domain
MRACTRRQVALVGLPLAGLPLASEALFPAPAYRSVVAAAAVATITVGFARRGCTIMAGSYDAIIIGAGHNGLVTACYLARAGWKVLVPEFRQVARRFLPISPPFSSLFTRLFAGRTLAVGCRLANFQFGICRTRNGGHGELGDGIILF